MTSFWSSGSIVADMNRSIAELGYPDGSIDLTHHDRPSPPQTNAKPTVYAEGLTPFINTRKSLISLAPSTGV